MTAGPALVGSQLSRSGRCRLWKRNNYTVAREDLVTTSPLLLISSEACSTLHLRHRQSRHSWHSWHRRDKLILLCLGEPVLTQNTTCDDTCFRFCIDMRPPWIWISLWKAGSPHLELEKQPANATMAWLHDFNTTHQILSFCNQGTISTGRAPPRWSAEARTSCQRKHIEWSQWSLVTWNSKYLVPATFQGNLYPRTSIPRLVRTKRISTPRCHDATSATHSAAWRGHRLPPKLTKEGWNLASMP